MVEPLSIAASAASLALAVTKIIKTLNDGRKAWRDVGIVVVSITTECAATNVLLSRLQQLVLQHQSSLALKFTEDAILAEAFEALLLSLTQVVSLISADVEKLSENLDNLPALKKIGFFWNEDDIEKKLGLIRNQKGSVRDLLAITQS